MSMIRCGESDLERVGDDEKVDGLRPVSLGRCREAMEVRQLLSVVSIEEASVVKSSS